MRILLGAVLFAHAIAHIVGFVVPWRLLTSADVPYRTTILAGSVDLGAAGIKALGIVWLAAAIAFIFIAAALFVRTTWWLPALVAMVLASIVLCVLGWPDARIGIAANALILGLLATTIPTGWLTVP